MLYWPGRSRTANGLRRARRHVTPLPETASGSVTHTELAGLAFRLNIRSSICSKNAMSPESRASGNRLMAGTAHELNRHLPLPVPEWWLNRLLMLEDLKALHSEATRRAGDRPLFSPLLEALGVSVAAFSEDIARIPSRGPVVVIANHPFGLLEGPILGHLLLQVRPDVRFMANSLLRGLPELREYIIPVDPFGGSDATMRNRGPLRQCLSWLESGGLLVVFPAGEVSSLQLKRMRVEDPTWSSIAARLVKMTNSTVVPVYIHGANGPAFQAAGLLHPRIRTALLAWELLNKRGMTARVTIGGPLCPTRLAGFQSDKEATEYLRSRVHVLRWRSDAGHRNAVTPQRVKSVVTNPVEPEAMRNEVAALPKFQLLLQVNGLSVFVAEAEQLPQTLREIGRLREISFRQAGEGTGNEIDLDRYDSHYQHLFVWNQERSEVVGAYRLAYTDDVIRRFGPQGLYTSSLFQMHPQLFKQLGPSIELGRSFVRQEYQKKSTPLLLLWSGIGQIVVRRPECRHLFGPVSISGDYTCASREVMVSFLREKSLDRRLASMVRPRNGFQIRHLHSEEFRTLAELMRNTKELGEVVSGMDPQGRSIPVLLRQYLNLGARFLGFNVDRAFSGVVDGLVLVDLLQTNPKLRQRYLGSEGDQTFISYHSSRAAGTGCIQVAAS